MANFIAIAGPSATGKTTLWESLKGVLPRDTVFVPDLYTEVWDELKRLGYFKDFTEIMADSDYTTLFILRLLDKYRETMDKYQDTDALVIMDSCWIDISVYSLIQMWYNHIIQEVQEQILHKLAIYDDSLNHVFITTNDDQRYKPEKYRSPFKNKNVKTSRPLELQYYRLFSNFKNAEELPTSDLQENLQYIYATLNNLGYLD